MGRYTESSCRLCRGAGEKLFLKGEKCQTKCTLEKRKGKPGAHAKLMKKTSEYGRRFKEKQKARRIAGLTEEQFRNYFRKAQKMSGETGQNLLLLLETRLDNVVRRMGFAPSMRFARQVIMHRNIKVNDVTKAIPAYRVKPGDKVSLDTRFKENPALLRWAERFTNVPSWLSVDREKLTGEVLALPRKEDISYPVEVSLIVELYSK